MSTQRTGFLDIAPHLNGIISVREDGAKIKVGSTELSVTGLAEVAGDTDQMVIASGKVVTINNTLTFAGTDGTTMTFPSTTGTVATIGLANTWALAQTFTAAIVPTGGVGAAGGFSTSPRLMHTGDLPARVSTDGTNATPSATETYIAEVFVPANVTLTGVAIFNGATVGTDKHCVFLCDSAGAAVANTATAGVTTSGADAYQRIPFTATYAAKGPATYYVALQMNGATDRYNAHGFGNFGASKATSTVFGTLASITPPTTFTADLGPIASLY